MSIALVLTAWRQTARASATKMRYGTGTGSRNQIGGKMNKVVSLKLIYSNAQNVVKLAASESAWLVTVCPDSWKDTIIS